jgi:hypothetical protein
MPKPAPLAHAALRLDLGWPPVAEQGVRVFYDVAGGAVEVLAIVAKSQAEPWLARFGSAE